MKEQIKKAAEAFNYDCDGFDAGNVHAFTAGAEWMQEYMLEKFKLWVDQNIFKYTPVEWQGQQKVISDFEEKIKKLNEE